MRILERECVAGELSEQLSRSGRNVVWLLPLTLNASSSLMLERQTPDVLRTYALK
jgi:hypothetical protein